MCFVVARELRIRPALSLGVCRERYAPRGIPRYRRENRLKPVAYRGGHEPRPVSLPPTPEQRARAGVLYALAAFSTWGLLVPLRFKLLGEVPALQILSHRIVWGSLFALALVVAGRKWRALAEVFVPSRRLALLSLSACLVGTNWLVYIWAVNAGHLVQTSLGYFINPLVNVGSARFSSVSSFVRRRWQPVFSRPRGFWSWHPHPERCRGSR